MRLTLDVNRGTVTAMSRLRGRLSGVLGVDPRERSAVLLSCLLFFLLMSGYYILRPLREEMGLAGGVENLPYLFLVTMAAMVLAQPLFGYVVRRYPRDVCVPATYRIFAANILVFYLCLVLAPPAAMQALGRVFYVWVSVFNLFAVSLFWALLAGGFGYERSRRLFGLAAIGGTAGAMAGSGMTTLLVAHLGRNAMLLVSLAFMEAATRAAQALSRRFAGMPDARADTAAASTPAPERGAAGGSVFGGIRLTFGSSYLAAVGAYLFLYSLTSTFLYFAQADIVAGHIAGREARTAFFAAMDFWTNAVALCGQLLLAGPLLRRWGAGPVLALLPAVTAGGFLALGASPTPAALAGVRVCRSATNYALAKPARETLFTVVDRDTRYKAKSFIDTFVYRLGDALGAGVSTLLGRLGPGLPALAGVAVGAAAAWAALSAYLGRRQRALAGRPEGI